MGSGVKTAKNAQIFKSTEHVFSPGSRLAAYVRDSGGERPRIYPPASRRLSSENGSWSVV
jgi:hypothetical protein